MELEIFCSSQPEEEISGRRLGTCNINMFHRLPTVCIGFCTIANYIPINSINILNLIGFLVKAECVFCKIESKCFYVI